MPRKYNFVFLSVVSFVLAGMSFSGTRVTLTPCLLIVIGLVCLWLFISGKNGS